MIRITCLALAAFPFAALAASADGNHANHAIKLEGAILSDADSTKIAALDILAAHAHRKGNVVTFHMTTQGTAGTEFPAAIGSVDGSDVWSYVWPTSLAPPLWALKAVPGF